MFHTSPWHRPTNLITWTVSFTLFLSLTLFSPSAYAQSATRQSPTTSKSPQHPANAKSVTITVTSDVVWKDTGISVKVGDPLNISATGTWSADPTSGNTGPDGYPQEVADNFLNLHDIGVCSTCASYASPHWGALIGYIGSNPPAAGSYTSTGVLPDAQKVFPVGSNYQGQAPLAGELWLTFNDDAYSANTGDNTGQVTASVTVTSSPSPGGTWISPANNFVIQGTKVHFAAHAYPTNSGGPAIDHVNFTAWWSGVDPNHWYIACTVKPTSGTDVYQCDWNLKYQSGQVVPSGQLKVSFDVYDVAGNSNLAPNGIHQGTLIYTLTFPSRIWAGYIVGGTSGGSKTYSDVKGSWTVPLAHCSRNENSESAFWIGLGGTSQNAPLEQIATETNCKNGRPSYAALYEMVPALAQIIAKPVKANDKIFAEVQYVGNGQFLLQITDSTQGWTFRKVFSGNTSISARNSAEWIAEAPTEVSWIFRQIQSLTNFGTVNFSNCLADNLPINHGPYVFEAVMSNNGVLLAQPTSLQSPYKALAVTWKHH